MTYDSILQLAQGALGGLTFSMYHMYLTNQTIKENMRVVDLEWEELRTKHEADMEKLRNQIEADM